MPRIKITFPTNTIFFLKQRAEQYGMTVPAFIRHLVFRDLERCKKAPATIRPMSDKERTESIAQVWDRVCG